jgi:tetratricopeptide (TPR) repeat protein
MTDTLEAPPASTPDHQNLIPGWLALLVLALLVAVVGLGGFAIRGCVEQAKVNSPIQEEISRYTEAVQLDPGSNAARLNLAYAYQRDRQFDRALDEYAVVLKTEPRDPAALYNSGVIYIELDAGAKGEALLWKVLESDPTHALAAKALGTYYADLGHYRSVIKAVRPVVEADPTLADLQYLMGLAYEKTGRLDWAIERYKLAVKYGGYKQARDALRRLGEEDK